MQTGSDRREFLKMTVVAAAGAAAGSLALSRSAHAAGSDVLRIGLVGCGARGGGAAANALGADANTRLVAMADAFSDRLQNTLESLKRQFDDRVTVDAEHCFVGFDAYQRLIDSGVDVVLLATSPHFRPIHLKACIDAGKHVFCEKPVAVDGPGVRSVLATCQEAAEKKLNVVSGLCWRYDYGVRETMKRVLDGDIGDIISIRETFNTGTLWHRRRQPSWTEMEYQMRNWYYFTWLSGDHNCEQHVHSLDKAAWAMHEEPPVRAWGLGGRQVRTEAIYGDIFDHHAVCYEYANGVQVYSYCRQMAGCSDDVSDLFLGTQGRADILANKICNAKGEVVWRYQGPKPSMYDVEHQELFAAIRSGKVINNGVYMARSSMLAILGRMVTHSGQTITWDRAIHSGAKLAPEKYAMDATPPIVPDKDGKYPVSVPGVTRVV
ncbi:MAG: Gfo/Idh/MocA family protein [Thermoguttaceae bacterium]